MSKGKEMTDKQVDEEKVEHEFDEEDHEGEGDDYDDYNSEIEEDVFIFEKISSIGGPWVDLDCPRPNKSRKSNTFDVYDGLDLSLGIKPQDADYLYTSSPTYNSPLSYELENTIAARIPLLEFRKLSLICKRFLKLIRNGDLLRERRIIGKREASVFMLASGEKNWWAFDQGFTYHKALPVLPSDDVFRSLDKESLCAGTQLLVCGTDVDGPVIWTYEVMTNQWFKGFSMIEPRCLFASASTGDVAFVAGGLDLKNQGILNTVEKYDPLTKSWEPLPRMKERRKMCSGVYMDEKFYVIGGQNQNGDILTCAEVFDEKKNTWVFIPGILNGLTLPTPQSTPSPPLVAVVDNELYTIETSTNCLMVYLKKSNSWKDLGPIPVRADINKGWGVAFKSLGTELLVIGGSTISPSGRGMSIYTCCPNPKAENMDWKPVDGGGNGRSHFIMNCTVMVA